MADETILLIDIDESTEQKIVSALESKGYLVFTAAGRDAAVQIAEKVQPSLICINPAPSGGLEMCRELHDKALLKDVPIMVTTSYKGTMDPRYTSLYGIVDFLTLPFSQEELFGKVEACLVAGMPGLQNERAEEAGISAEDTGQPVPGEGRETGEEKEDTAVDAFSYDDDAGSTVAEEPFRKEEKEALAAAFKSRRPARRSESGNRTLLLVLALILVTASGIAAGLYGYRFFVQKTVDTQPQSGKPDMVQQDTAKTQPLQEPPQERQPLQETVQKPAEELSVQEPVPDTGKEVVAAGKTSRQVVYSIQAGAFRSEANAEVLAKKIREKGIDASVRKGQTKDKETVYRVLIGEYSEKKHALASAGEIENKAAIKVAIFSE